MKRIFVIYCFIVGSFLIAKAQTITGKLIDETSQPISFANIVLLSLPDSTFVAGTISDEQGAFSIETITQDKRICRISSVGYQTVYRESNGNTDLGVIPLKSDTQLLGEVVIKANRPQTRMKGDAMVTGVEGTILEKAGTAGNLLDKIPNVSSEGGAVAVFGRGAAEIYINGRKMRDSSELDKLSADNIKAVEVVTNPGVRYDASVKAVIRIVTKRAPGDGFGFSNRAYASYNKKWTMLDQFDFNYRTGGFDLSGILYGYDSRNWSEKGTVQHTFLDKKWQQNSIVYTDQHQQYFSTSLLLNYQFSADHIMGLRYDYDRTPYAVQDMETPTEMFQDNTRYQESNSCNRTDWQNDSHRLNAYYNGKVGEWNIDLNADGYWNALRKSALSDEEIFFPEEERRNYQVNTFSRTRNSLLAGKLIFTHPLWQGNLSFGGEYSYTHRTNSYLNPEQILQDDESKINEGSLGAFAEYARRFGKVNLQAGIRYERVDFDYYEYGKKIDVQSKSYNNVFPSLSLSFPIGKINMQLGYAADIMRPSYSQLSSSITYVNQYTYESGNPFLSPTLSHNVTLGGAYKWINISLGYSRVKDAMLFFSDIYEENNPTIALYKRVNMSSAYDKVFASFTMSPVIGIWRPQFSVRLLKQWYDADTPNGIRRLDDPLFSCVWRNSLELPAGLLLNVDEYFTTKGYMENQQVLRASYYTNLSLYKAFLKECLSFQLQGNNLFRPHSMRVRLYSGAIRLMEMQTVGQSSVSLTVRYKFNSTRRKYRGTGAGESQKSRM